MKTIILLFSISLINLNSNSILQKSEVYLCDSSGGKKYHYTSKCRGLSNCKHEIIKVELKKAKALGKTLCGWE